ncbi:hypothetical protein [Paenibacillus durus]|uniref:Peptide ABC transporter permease n=1 Tax=Paenibacillus durus TaxID=44251 RepID=A0A089HXC5_PAEDU|nr:hypothetical protein [Paenibacillus durus]AIQ15013.1 hypothetical protein PDUR_26420 [Paenibacillus durus]
MKRRHNIRDLIYVSRNDPDNKCFCSYGIEFHEFMSCVDHRPDNLILLKHNFVNTQWNRHSRFDYVTSQEINELINDHVYRYGDFCWVDFNEEELDKLTALQIAELLYFGHLGRSLSDIPKIKYAYYAHDDGWYNRLYVTEKEDYKILLARVIVSKIRRLTRRLVGKIPSDISTLIFESTKQGLFIDLSKINKNRIEIKIPITTVGHYTNMDKVYNLKDEIIDYKTWLVFSKKKWKFVKED